VFCGLISETFIFSFYNNHAYTIFSQKYKHVQTFCPYIMVALFLLNIVQFHLCH